MISALYIFVGGGLGSLARFGFARGIGTSESGFPMGTLMANLAACLILGFMASWVIQKPDMDPNLKNGIMVGFCGGFSTFSTFSSETFGLVNSDKPLLAGAYIALSVVLCYGGIWLGQKLI